MNMNRTTDLREAIAGELRAALARDGRSLTDLAHDSGVSKAALSRKLKGDTAVSVEELLRISVALDVSPASIVDSARTSPTRQAA